ncbi:putative indole-3-acetic acid-amido synthetase GH3.6 [Rosa sericea]
MTDEELLKNVNDSTLNATRHQHEALSSILHQNGTVRYLQPHLPHHNAPLDAATFRRAVPLSTYDDYADVITQMAETSLDHQQPLLSVDPLLCFFYSSGTSSPRPKLIPYFDSKLSKAASYIAHQGSAAILRRLFPPRPSVNKILWLIYADDVTTTRGGVKVMAASTYPLQSGNVSWSQFSFVVSPREVILGSHVERQMYCHLLCGIRNCDLLDAIRAPYAVGLVKVFSVLESKWEQLCRDLEDGFPSLEISDSAMRDSVIEVLGGPQVDLAKRVRAVCEGNNWGGIVSKLWPNVRYVRCVTTGSMEQYYPKLKYYAGEIPLLGGDYFASECCVGINMDIMQPPDKTRFVLLPTAAYFEFLPFDMNEAEATGRETVDISGVEVGKMYEVVVTTYRGFYRYLLGDVVRVVGFYNLSPLVEFVMRAPKGPGEIITERDLMSAMQSFQLVFENVMATEITEFASFLDMELSPKQLKVFVEAREGSRLMQEESVVAVRRCYSSLEDGLGSIYKVQRDRGEAGPLILSVVKPGSFDRLSQVAIANGASAGQYKPPKIIRNREVVHFLEGFTVVTIS